MKFPRALFINALIGITALMLAATGCTPAANPNTQPTFVTSTLENPQTPPSATTTVTPATTAVTTIPATTTPAVKELILSSTTSVRDSGLMDVLIPMFESETGYKVKPIYNGSGAAIALGQAGQADVLVVHSPAAELTFVAGGYGINRTFFAHNDYIVVGPSKDPAGIKGMTSTVAAFKKIAAAGSLFYSRGDASGTDTKEKSIWTTAAITQKGQSWYVEANTGMGDLLRIASEKGGYTLTDRSTYIAQKSTLSLDIMVENDFPTLINTYHVIQVNPGAFPGIKLNAEGGRAFVRFMVSPEAQRVIADFGVDKYGQPLFYADAGKSEAFYGTK
ncbi:MAG: substrate-binding domain-containing protein [Dehalococcoidales bacterium]|nr:substrate-binding domain-containing protein [Dehalococcoidales bacterium]